MTSAVKLTVKDISQTRWANQYDQLEKWINNHMPDGGLSPEEVDHIRSVMQKDQELKRTDADRICRLTGTFPYKLKPELMTAAVEEMRLKNPAVPGSGLVSLCAPVALDRLPQTPSGTSNLGTTSPNTPFFSLGGMTPTEIAKSVFTFKPKAKANWDNEGLCPFCYRAFTMFRKAFPCVQCHRGTCSRCATEVEKSVFLCKDCVDLARVLCKTGDWFAQYLAEKPATAVKPGVDDSNMENRRRRKSRFKFDGAGEPNLEVPSTPESKSPVSPTNFRANPLLHDGNVVLHPRVQQERPSDRRVQYRPDKAVDGQRVSTNNEKKLSHQVKDKRYTISGAHEITPKNDQSMVGPPNLGRSKSQEQLYGVDQYEDAKSGKKTHVKSKTSKHSFKHHSLEHLNMYAYQSEVEIQGEVEFSMEYEAAIARLAIMVYEVRNLATDDKHTGKTHLYMKVFLQPYLESSTIKKITYKGDDQSPQFNQAVWYSVSPSELARYTVTMELWQKKKKKNKRGKADLFLGQVSMPLKDYKWNDTSRKRKQLTNKSAMETDEELPTYVGEIKVGLRFALYGDSQAAARKKNGDMMLEGELEVHILEATNLVSEFVGTNINAVTRASLVSNHQEFESYTTESIPKTNNPKWNTVIRFKEMIQKDLLNLALELSVMHQIMGRKNDHVLGGIRLCVPSNNPESHHKTWKDCTIEEAFLWSECIRKPDQLVSATLPLHKIFW
ncbi:Synaptotagmin-like protein 4 [Clonorchis sinensis]|uniref:Synaptotagmin-like protein 4 n=1 Tax=Clonorchis sinensis TaxID=79923 RepID=A0A8T1M3P2_CLOSI|nr:Synaptotagmin-like protein 4 [Clonorchis sinensis]